jgi:mannose-1-phosphate guanylyltransferase
MSMSNDVWGMVLAAGEGKRLQGFLQEQYGSLRPKQFSAIVGTRSMLRHTLDRANRLVPSQNLLTIVSEHHLTYALEDLKEHERAKMMVMPYNRETAPSILLALLRIKKENSNATVVIFPSDHFVREEQRFLAYVEKSVAFVEAHPELVVLLGVRPHGPDTGYGWIEPAETYTAHQASRFYGVQRFIEKPPTDEALRLYHQGALWNSMVTIAKVATIEQLFQEHLPELYHHVEESKELYRDDASFLKETLERMPVRNFSRDLLELAASNLRVLDMHDVRWSDWGTPHRIQSDLAEMAVAIPA